MFILSVNKLKENVNFFLAFLVLDFVELMMMMLYGLA